MPLREHRELPQGASASPHGPPLVEAQSERLPTVRQVYSAGDISKRVSEVLEIVGLKGNEEIMPSDLSGGMRKRVALARAIVRYPEIILYDEPTTGLDPIMANTINQLIIDLSTKLKITSIVVTHDMKSTFMVADRIALLYRGQIIQTGPVKYFQTSPDPFIRQFVEGNAQGPFEEEVGGPAKH